VVPEDGKSCRKGNPFLPRFCRGAPDKLSLDPEDIGFISANSWDVAGAKAFGFRVHWVNRSGAPAEQLGSVPDLTIHNLTALVAQSSWHSQCHNSCITILTWW
jgi:hypothetical protein